MPHVPDTMSPATKEMSLRCASSIPPGLFGLDDVVVIGEIIYYTFQIWKECHGRSNPEQSGGGLVAMTFGAINNHRLPTGFYTPQILNLSVGGFRRACHFKGIHPTRKMREVVVTHILDFVSKQGDIALIKCFSESPISAVEAIK